jgi:hypothetical protein
LGLAERVAALDGTFTAGATGDRFEVRVALPARPGSGRSGAAVAGAPVADAGAPAGATEVEER